MADDFAISPIVYVPMNVDAFILNKTVCDTGPSRIAPITQPDYLGLRPDPSQIRSDLLPHVDVTASQPASTNSRVSATETLQQSTLDPNNPQSDVPSAPPLRQNRIGVYVHWSLPRLYKAAFSAADDVRMPDNNKARLEYQNLSRNPQFRLVPNRWYVVRNIKSSVPEAPPSEKRRAWVVHSDMIFDINDLGPEVDLETDVSPFVTNEGSVNDANVLNRQSSVYIGAKFPAESWPENVPANRKATKLTTMNSSNFCFADNAVHNPNVFSIIDNFQYQDAANNTQYLSKVTCDYFIVGWHSNEYDDPLNFKTGTRGPLIDRLHALFLEPPNNLTTEMANTSNSGLTVSHGAIYNVQYNRDVKPNTPADKFAEWFKPNSDIKMEPVSVGTTALDSILTFLRAHEDQGDAIFGPGGSSLAEDLLSLSQLLEAAGDDYDSRVKAADIIYARNFAPSEGGRAWHYDGKAKPGGAPAMPGTNIVTGTDASERQLLRRASEIQHQLDTAKRKLNYCRWKLFMVWWSFVSDVHNQLPERITYYRDLLQRYRAEATTLVGLISTPNVGLESQVSAIVDIERAGDIVMPAHIPARSIPQPTFFKRRDPTICLVGMDSGWPAEYMGYVPSRIASNLTRNHPGLFPTVGPPGLLPQALLFLVNEAFDREDHGDLLGFKQWNGQPWCPLYVEWEADYYHIPIDKWSVSLLASPVDKIPRVRYGVKEALPDNPASTSDETAVSGRTILLPHSGINMQALVEQVLTDPSITLSDQEITNLKLNLNKLKFSIAEIDGFTTNLLTCNQGSHLQPNFTEPGADKSYAIKPALTAGAPIGFTEDDFALIADETALTPYGGLIDFSKAPGNPFKGVTHGQMRFTKLNVIDKFGQVISAIPPELEPKDPFALRPSIYPCLGDQVCPGLVPDTNELNTVTPLTEVDHNLPGDYPLCPYIQLTPVINQDARLNASFVVPQAETIMNISITRWRTANDWEDPVFAWIIVNVADQALQFFTGEGIFYVEMSLGGAADQIKSPSWQPFKPPSRTSVAVSPQLVELIAMISDPQSDGAYLRAFWSMIAQSLANMPFTPGSYGTYATSIVGRPFALVNAGFSLELALPPLESTVIPPLRPSDGGQTTDANALYSYRFPIKIGDRDRPFDGVVGYFDSIANKTNWSKLYTYYTSSPGQEPNDPRVGITPGNYDSLSPYYIHPEGSFGLQTFMKLHEGRLTVKTLILDPFTAAHVYTPILPVKSFKLHDWMVQKTLEKMSAFFHVGPILLTQDVPATYDPSKAVTADDWGRNQQSHEVSQESAPVKLPIASSRNGAWKWLQPYPLSEGSPDGRRRYNGFDVGPDDGRLRLDPAPYTMVEGFLQLMKPPVKEDIG